MCIYIYIYVYGAYRDIKPQVYQYIGIKAAGQAQAQKAAADQLRAP